MLTMKEETSRGKRCRCPMPFPLSPRPTAPSLSPFLSTCSVSCPSSALLRLPLSVFTPSRPLAFIAINVCRQDLNAADLLPLPSFLHSVKVSDDLAEFEVALRHDTMAPRYRLWFWFTVSNSKKSQRAIISVVGR